MRVDRRRLIVGRAAAAIMGRSSRTKRVRHDRRALLGIKAHYADRNATTPAGITFKDVGNADIAHLDLQANRPVVIDVEGGDDNPFTGNPITYALASNGRAAAEVTIQIVKAGDSTP
jgi:hypothetical protein